MSNNIIPASDTGGLLDLFFDAAREFSSVLSSTPHNDLRGITDGKAVGTYIKPVAR
jgi:hypothetical protein